MSVGFSDLSSQSGHMFTNQTVCDVVSEMLIFFEGTEYFS